MFNDQTTKQAIEIFTSTQLSCEDRTPHRDFCLNCVQTKGTINTTLTILLPLQTNTTITIECSEDIISSDETQARIDLHVTGKLKQTLA